MCVPNKTHCPTLKGRKWGYLVFHRKRLERRVLPWQQHGRCHSVCTLLVPSLENTAPIFLQISILDFVVYCLSGTINDVTTFLTCIIQCISLKWKSIFLKGKRHSSLLGKASQISCNCFLLHKHFNPVKTRPAKSNSHRQIEKSLGSNIALSWNIFKKEYRRNWD